MPGVLVGLPQHCASASPQERLGSLGQPRPSGLAPSQADWTMERNSGWPVSEWVSEQAGDI